MNRLKSEIDMKRRDEGKTSLVEFLRSIKFTHEGNANAETECVTHFAHFNPSARASTKQSAEDSQLIRSAN